MFWQPNDKKTDATTSEHKTMCSGICSVVTTRKWWWSSFTGRDADMWAVYSATLVAPPQPKGPAVGRVTTHSVVTKGQEAIRMPQHADRHKDQSASCWEPWLPSTFCLGQSSGQRNPLQDLVTAVTRWNLHTHRPKHVHLCAGPLEAVPAPIQTTRSLTRSRASAHPRTHMQACARPRSADTPRLRCAAHTRTHTIRSSHIGGAT
jgi:hypothetical protein